MQVVRRIAEYKLIQQSGRKRCRQAGDDANPRTFQCSADRRHIRARPWRDGEILRPRIVDETDIHA